MSLAPGTKLGPYEIIAPLGAGGMGEVWRAKDTRLGREVAVKVLPQHLSADPDRRARFEREARAASALSHPHLCTLYDVGRAPTAGGSGETDYLVMELLEGETLAQRLQRGPLPAADVARFGAQVARALSAAHRAGLVHRDLKPGNVVLTKHGAKLLDFGLARPIAVGGATSDLTSGPTVAAVPGAPLTAQGTLVGTYQYMAPEQLEGREADARADLWALGCVLYEMASGRPAFAGESHASLIASILKEEPRAFEPASGAPPAGTPPPAFERLLRRLLAKDPDERWQSAHDAALVLEGLGDPAVAAAVAVAAPVEYRQLTYRRGRIGAARFLPDGQTVVYSAAWADQPERLFIRRLDGADAAELAVPPASLLAVSRQGELAVSRDRVWRLGFAESTGTLCRVPAFGGTVREWATGVHEADWKPDGRDLVLVRRDGEALCVETGPGERVSESPYWKTSLRVSPDGRRLAWFTLFRPGGNEVVVADVGGTERTLLKFQGWPGGLAWSPDGSELWFGAYGGPEQGIVRAVALDGRTRTLLRLPGGVNVEDVSPAGDLLLLEMTLGCELAVFGGAGERERNLSWFDMSLVKDLSADGRQVLFDETGAAMGADPQVFLRDTNGAPPIALGGGFARALSPDGRWAIGSRPGRIVVLPTGAGQAYEIPAPGGNLSINVCWFPDGRRLLSSGTDPDGSPRLYEIALPDGTTRAVTPPGAGLAWGIAARPLDDDGRRAFARTAPAELTIFEVATGERLGACPLPPDRQPLRWHADGERVLVTEPGRYPTVLEWLDTRTGALTERRELALADSTGVYSTRFAVATADASTVAVTVIRQLSQLHLVRGLR